MPGSPRRMVVRGRAFLGDRRDLILVSALLGRGSDACSHTPSATSTYGIDDTLISVGTTADSDAEVYRVGPSAGASPGRSLVALADNPPSLVAKPAGVRAGGAGICVSRCPTGSPLFVLEEGSCW